MPRCLGVTSLLSAVAAVAGLLTVASTGTATNAGGAWTFLTNPDLEPPSVSVLVQPHSESNAITSPREYLFLAPIKNFGRNEPFVGKPGPEILEVDGNPVWQQPLGAPIHVGSNAYNEVAMDFHTATYEGHPVIVWWHGHITPNGYGNGTWQIDNDHYRMLASVRAPKSYETDFHAFEITSSGMAYLLGDRIVRRRLTCCGARGDGKIYDQVVLEVDIKTDRTVWTWDPLKHVPLRASYEGISYKEPWDPYRLNSIALDPEGDLLVSARNDWAAYWIRREGPHAGGVAASLGGKHSSFSLGGNAHFAWQHDVSYLPGHLVGVFADEAYPPEAKQSRGLVLSLDWSRHSARLVHQYLLPHPELSASQGSVQLLPGGNVFVGWGELRYFAEYDPTGKLLYLASFHSSDESYRAYKAAWVGLPLTTPSIAVTTGADGAADVDASWNGATKVLSWQLLAGSSPAALSASGSPVSRQGFETTIATASPGPYYSVEAIGAANEVLGTAQPVRRSE